MAPRESPHIPAPSVSPLICLSNAQHGQNRRNKGNRGNSGERRIVQNAGTEGTRTEDSLEQREQREQRIEWREQRREQTSFFGVSLLDGSKGKPRGTHFPFWCVSGFLCHGHKSGTCSQGHARLTRASLSFPLVKDSVGVVHILFHSRTVPACRPSNFGKSV